jgi:hypothetical protein
VAEKLNFDLLKGRNDLGKALDQNSKKASNLQDVLKTAAGVFTGAIAVKGFDLLTSAVGSAIGSLKESIELSAIQEKAVNNLNASLARAGNLFEGVSEELQNYASSLQQASTFGDEVILDNIALLQSLTNLDKDGLKVATQSALDLAAAQGIDLESATRLVARATQGNTDILRRYGVEVQKGSSNAETFANALTQINAQFGGAAQSQLNTYAGVTQAVSNAIGDFQEQVGDLATQNTLVLAGIRTFKEVVEDLTQEFSEGKSSIDEYVNDGLVALADASIIAAKTVDAIVRGITAVGQAATLSVQGIKGLVAGITDLVGITDNALAESSQNIESTFDSLGSTLSSEGIFGDLANGLENFKNRALQINQEIIASEGSVIQNQSKRVDAEDEVNAKLLQSRQDLNAQLQQALIDQQIAEQQIRLQQGDISDQQREEELQKLAEFEARKNEIILDSELAKADQIADIQQREIAQQIAKTKFLTKSQQDQAKTEKQILDERAQAQRLFETQIAGIVGAGANLVAAITKSGSKEAFLAQQAAAAAQAIVSTNLAAAQALATPPAPNKAAAAIARTSGFVNVAAILAQTVKGFQEGGVVGGFSGASIGSDNTTINAREGELILNAQQQATLFEAINSGNLGGQKGDVIVQIDGREIARAVRDQRASGFV